MYEKQLRNCYWLEDKDVSVWGDVMEIRLMITYKQHRANKLSEGSVTIMNGRVSQQQEGEEG